MGKFLQLGFFVLIVVTLVLIYSWESGDLVVVKSPDPIAEFCREALRAEGHTAKTVVMNDTAPFTMYAFATTDKQSDIVSRELIRDGFLWELDIFRVLLKY